MPRVNTYGQPIGSALSDWTPPAMPGDETLTGRYCFLERLDPKRHAAALFAAYAQAPDGRDWTYMSTGPFATQQDYATWATVAAQSATQHHYAIIDRVTQLPVGTMALLRIVPEHGCLEVGAVMLAPAGQRTRVATEAQYVLMRYVFELGYRRYEWKCDSLNAASIRAACRLGFTYEGLRVARLARAARPDLRTIHYVAPSVWAWFAIIDQDWPMLQQAFEQWLVPENFDAQGNQIQRLKTRVNEL